MIEPWLYPLLTITAMVAGFIDAIAGGGGLLMMPALLFAGVPPLAALGTNKLQSCCGTAMACRTYRRAGLVTFRGNRMTILVVAAGAAGGALFVQAIDTRLLTLLIPLLLLFIAGYIALSPRMTDQDARERIGGPAYAPVGGLIGAYDGFFGPGTGSFFTASLVGLRGLGLTRATALTKLYNLASNAGALLVFALGGHVLWLLGLCLAAGAMAGGWLGSRSALRFGAALIRPLLLAISLLLTLRLLWGYLAG